MTGSVPEILLDTCSIINLSYCQPVATIFRSRYEGAAGWTRAAKDELVRQRGRRPPHPQALHLTTLEILQVSPCCSGLGLDA